MSTTTPPRSASADHVEFDHTSAGITTFPDKRDLHNLARNYNPADLFIPLHFWYRTLETLNPVETFGTVPSTVSAPTFIGGVSGAGSRVVNGAASVSVVIANLAPNQPVCVSLDQTAGVRWNWYATRSATRR